ncbi:MAG: sulfite reductase subunit alpha [Verrucomicrobia bacterium]|nr:sulfite reductase subunit alpha [Verrucomicrobiota bacterium]
MPNPEGFGRKNPFRATLLRTRSLTGPGSGKDTRHFEISLSGSGLSYLPGDSLGVFPRCPPSLVQATIDALGFQASDRVQTATGQDVRLEEALSHHVSIHRASKKILYGLAERLPAGSSERSRLEALIADEPAAAEFLHPRDYLDLLKEFPAARFESPQAFLKMLSPIQPRLYSIASSPSAHIGEVHLCVAVVRYQTFGRNKTGLASGFLADHTTVGEPNIPVFVQGSAKFRLPSDRSRDIIMVGPGTGIAPFRAFLEQREIDGGSGRNWLFFGEQHRATDFLYQADIEGFLKRSVLSRLDVAFSRDQAAKVYVQHRMLEQAAELWRWIQGGAYFYVCGDARRMAKDVHATLVRIVSEQGGMTPENATVYVEETMARQDKRYLKDVY